MENYGFKINMTITGIAVAVKTNKEDIDAKLQFINIDDKGMQNIDLKVVGATKNELSKFIGKQVKISDVSMAQVDFNKYYKVENISKVQLVK